MTTELLQRISAIFFQPLFGPNPDLNTVITAVALGAVSAIVLPCSARFLSWFRLHFLHRSKLTRYNHSKRTSGSEKSISTKASSLPSSLPSSSHSAPNNHRPWALITGASDGIGAAFVSELAEHNFNIILHGRNTAKLSSQITKLRTLFPHVQFEIWLVDATAQNAWDAAFTSLQNLIIQKGIYLTVLINNIGGNPDPDKSFTTLARYEPDTLNALVDMNITFPAQVTRLLLAELVQNQPALVLNMSSVVATQPLPYLCTYSGAKAFNLQFSRAFRLEMMAEGHADVEVLGVTAARVKSAGSGDVAVNWVTPSSKSFARSALRLVGCGRAEVCGWWAHDVQMWGMGLLPEWMAEWVLLIVSRKEKRTREQGK